MRVAGSSRIPLCSSLALSLCLSGCSWDQLFQHRANTLSNSVAIDRALKACSLTAGDQPFHLKLEVAPPAQAPERWAEIEVYWLNPITYRTVIRSRELSQTRIVNGDVVEEHDTGEFLPRWIDNFVAAVLEPIPQVAVLRRIPGEIPIGDETQGCITQPAPSAAAASSGAVPARPAEACFAGREPKITSGRDQTRYAAFDGFEPFAGQQIARDLVVELPDSSVIHARIAGLEPLARQDYALLKAKEFTLPEKQILTTAVAGSAAEALLEPAEGPASRAAKATATERAALASQPGIEAIVYLRTDRSGRVREVYRDTLNQFGYSDVPADSVVERALALRFRPLVVDGAARQMETTLALE